MNQVHSHRRYSHNNANGHDHDYNGASDDAIIGREYNDRHLGDMIKSTRCLAAISSQKYRRQTQGANRIQHNCDRRMAKSALNNALHSMTDSNPNRRRQQMRRMPENDGQCDNDYMNASQSSRSIISQATIQMQQETRHSMRNLKASSTRSLLDRRALVPQRRSKSFRIRSTPGMEDKLLRSSHDTDQLLKVMFDIDHGNSRIRRRCH